MQCNSNEQTKSEHPRMHKHPEAKLTKRISESVAVASGVHMAI